MPDRPPPSRSLATTPAAPPPTAAGSSRRRGGSEARRQAGSLWAGSYQIAGPEGAFRQAFQVGDRRRIGCAHHLERALRRQHVLVRIAIRDAVAIAVLQRPEDGVVLRI